MVERLTDPEQLNKHSERMLLDLGKGRYVVASFVTATAERLERAHDDPPTYVQPPTFIDVQKATQLILDGAARSFTSLNQITD